MISYRGFTKRFGAQRAVESLTLEVARGEVVALLGPNGSGKTTTLKAAAGLILPTAGEVTLGDPPRPAAEPAARRVLSYLPQKVSFPDALTGSEVVEFYRELRGAPAERSQKVLRFASLNGAGERAVGTYSGGMVQRLGLAVAMLPGGPRVPARRADRRARPRRPVRLLRPRRARARGRPGRALHLAPARRRRAAGRPLRRARGRAARRRA